MRILAAMTMIVLVAGCDGPLSLLTGGGPNVAANVQAGAENFQAANVTKEDQRLENVQANNVEQSSGDTKVRSDRTESVTVNEKDSWWLILGLALVAALAGAGWIHGWLTPSPREKRLIKSLSTTKP